MIVDWLPGIVLGLIGSGGALFVARSQSRRNYAEGASALFSSASDASTAAMASMKTALDRAEERAAHWQGKAAVCEAQKAGLAAQVISLGELPDVDFPRTVLEQ